MTKKSKTKPIPRPGIEEAIAAIFPEYWEDHMLEIEFGMGRLSLDSDTAEELFDRLVDAGFADDGNPDVDRNMRDGYQSVTHRMVHPEHGAVTFTHSMSWEPSLFEMPGIVSTADEVTWEYPEGKEEFYIGHRVD